MKKSRFTRTDWVWGGVAFLTWGAEAMALSNSAGQHAVYWVLSGLMLIAIGVVMMHQPNPASDPVDLSLKKVYWLCGALLGLIGVVLASPGFWAKYTIEPGVIWFTIALLLLYLSRIYWLIDTGE